MAKFTSLSALVAALLAVYSGDTTRVSPCPPVTAKPIHQYVPPVTAQPSPSVQQYVPTHVIEVIVPAYEVYFLKSGAEIESSELGDLLKIQKGMVELYPGRIEDAFIEHFIKEGGKTPDAMRIIDLRGMTIEILLNQKSPNYNDLKRRLGSRLDPYSPPRPIYLDP